MAWVVNNDYGNVSNLFADAAYPESYNYAVVKV